MFEKIIYCLITLVTSCFSSEDTNDPTKILSNALDGSVKKKKTGISRHQKLIGNGKERTSETINFTGAVKDGHRKIPKEIKKLKLGGISLYNENYKKKI